MPRQGYTFEPASGQVLTRLTQSVGTEVEAAVGAARAALPGWRGLSGHQRARYLYALARGIQKHARGLRAPIELRGRQWLDGLAEYHGERGRLAYADGL